VTLLTLLAGSGVAAVTTTATPGAGSVSATGASPSVVVNVIATPGAGMVTAAGTAPATTASSAQSAAPGVGVATAAGLAPSASSAANTNAAPGTGAGTLTGSAPALVLDVRPVPAAGALAATGQAPAVFASNVVTAAPDVGPLTAVGLAPMVTAGASATPASGVLAVAGYAPGVAGTVMGGRMPIRIATAAPAETTKRPRSFPWAALALSSPVVHPGCGALEIEGHAGLAKIDRSAEARTAALRSAGHAPEIMFARSAWAIEQEERDEEDAILLAAYDLLVGA
jgi:hypothetical protein